MALRCAWSWTSPGDRHHMVTATRAMSLVVTHPQAPAVIESIAVWNWERCSSEIGAEPAFSAAAA